MKLRSGMWNADVDFDLAAFHSLVRLVTRSKVLCDFCGKCPGDFTAGMAARYVERELDNWEFGLSGMS